jgi:2-succinyl-5-enolpyruvyl-6-hydroxy-3-cyclohexene-1-carboxylate synthase
MKQHLPNRLRIIPSRGIEGIESQKGAIFATSSGIINNRKSIVVFGDNIFYYEITGLVQLISSQ